LSQHDVVVVAWEEHRGISRPASGPAALDPAALTEFGNLLETFAVGELRRQASWLDERVALGHWRTSDGAEVDLVAEFDDGQVAAFEVKANERATSPAFAGLEQLRDVVGARFGAGVVLTTGRRSYTHSDRLHVMPIERLWQTIDLDAPAARGG
jgi:predicted AAA+ superfamily ATPase